MTAQTLLLVCFVSLTLSVLGYTTAGPVMQLIGAAVWFWLGTWKKKEITRQQRLRKQVMEETEADVEGYE